MPLLPTLRLCAPAPTREPRAGPAQLSVGEHLLEPVPLEFGFRQHRRRFMAQHLQGHLDTRVIVGPTLLQNVDARVQQRGDPAFAGELLCRRGGDVDEFRGKVLTVDEACQRHNPKVAVPPQASHRL
jgi:hypothetical protein